MADQFREVEAALGRLKGKFSEGKISQADFIDSLKQLRIKDGDGRFWMIGAQSGKWYFYDGREWVQAKPPSLSERKAICIYCGYENDLEAEICVRCGSQKTPDEEGRVCPRCGARLDSPSTLCPACEANAGKSPPAGPVRPGDSEPRPGEVELIVRSFHPASLFWFLGILGLFAGMLLGLLVGVTSFFPGVVASLPGFFLEIQGKLLGGIVFTVLGGLLGFCGGGAVGFVAAAVSNGVLSLVGGVRFRAGRTSPVPEDKNRP
jgi:ribosomal protein L40E